MIVEKGEEEISREGPLGEVAARTGHRTTALVNGTTALVGHQSS